KSKMGDVQGIDTTEITGKIQEVQKKYGIDADLAGAFLLNAVQQNPWGLSFLFGETGFSTGEFDRMVRKFYNQNGKTTSERLAPASEQLSSLRAKREASEVLTQRQGEVERARQEYYNAVDRARSRPNEPKLAERVEALRLRYEATQA